MVRSSLRKLNANTFGGKLITSVGARATASSSSCCNNRTQESLISRASSTTHTLFDQRSFYQQQQQQQRLAQPYHQQHLQIHTQYPSLLTTVQTQQRQFSSRRNNKKKVDPNAPLLNEHLIAALFKKKKRDDVSADTYEVRLIVDQGKNKNMDDDEDGAGTGTSTPTTQITTIHAAITLSHDLSLDLMEVNLSQTPPVIKAVDFDKHLYEQKKKERKSITKKKKEGGGAISDRPLKEFKFRAGIDDHDLKRKTNNMCKYLEKGHAIRVTLTARRHMLNADEGAIVTTLERVKELVGELAVEARGLKANEKKSYGSLLMHPKKSNN